MGLAENVDMFLDVRRVSGQVTPNVGTVGAALNAVAENDTVVVEGPGAWLSGAGNYLSVPDEAAFDITGDLCIVAKIAPDSWTPASTASFVSKWLSTGNQRSWQFSVTALGQLRFKASSGSSDTVAAASAALGYTDGTSHWVAVTLDVDDGAGNHTVSFWEGGTGSVPVWTLNQTDTTAGANPTILAGTADLTIGGINDGGQQPFDGVVEHVAVYDGIGADTSPSLGTRVFELTATNIAAATVDATEITTTSGHTLTVNRATSGPQTLIVPDGRTLLINPDESDAANKVTTGEGIVSEAIAYVSGNTTEPHLLIEDTAALFAGATSLDIVFAYRPDTYTPSSPAVVANAWTGSGSTDQAFTVNFHDNGKLRLITVDGAATVTNVYSNAAIPTGYTDPEWRVTWDTSGDVTMAGRERGSDTWIDIATDGTTGQTVALSASNPRNLAFGARSADGDNPGAGTLTSIAATTDLGTVTVTTADLARGAEGATTLAASTGHEITVSGDVQFYPTGFSGAAPTATFASEAYESVPDEAALDLTGDMSFIVDLSIDDVAAGALQSIIDKTVSGATNGGYILRIQGTSAVRFIVEDSGGSTTPATSSVDLDTVVSDGERFQLGVIVDVDNGAADADVTFMYRSTAADAWTQLGTVRNAGAVLAPAAGDSLLTIGGRSNSTSGLDGSIYAVQIYDGIGTGTVPGEGTLVFERSQADVARAASTPTGDGETYVSASGHTVTRNGSVTYAGDAPFVIPADEDALLMWAGVVGNRTGGVPELFELGSASASGTARLYVSRRNSDDGVNAVIHDGSSGTSSSGAQITTDADALVVHAVWVDRTDDLLRHYFVEADGSVTSATVDISAVGALVIGDNQIGFRSLVSLPGAMAAAVFDRGGSYGSDEANDLTAYAAILLATYTAPQPSRQLATTHSRRQLATTHSRRQLATTYSRRKLRQV